MLLAYKQAVSEVNRFGIPLSDAMDIKNQFRFRSPSQPQIDWSELAHDKATRAYYASDDPKNPMPRKAHRWRPPELT